MADDLRLLVNLLGHEMLVVALVDQLRGRGRLDDGPLDFPALFVPDLNTFARQYRPISVLEIAERVGEWRERNRVGAKIHFAAAVTDGERRPLTRADQEIVISGKEKSERKCAAQLLQCG